MSIFIMLEGLDYIDWDNLEHTYGDASDVPNLIRSTASKDEEKFRHYLKEHESLLVEF
jgi:hypothetical protein